MTSSRNHDDRTAREQAAAFILHEAEALGIAVGTDGYELAMILPMRIPTATRRDFKDAIDNYQDEIIAHILAENAP
jgi:hypothetical protein